MENKNNEQEDYYETHYSTGVGMRSRLSEYEASALANQTHFIGSQDLDVISVDSKLCGRNDYEIGDVA